MFEDNVPVPNVLDVIGRLDSTASFFTALDLRQRTDEIEQLIWWLYFTNRPVRRLALTPSPSHGVAKADYLRAARLAADDLKRVVATTSSRARALDELDDAVRRLIADDPADRLLDCTFGNNTRVVAKKVGSTVHALSGGFRGRLAEAVRKITPTTSLDLRGCRLAQRSNEFPQAMARLLSVKPARATAPEWLTIVAPPRTRVNQISLECTEDLKTQASRKVVEGYYLRWFEELGLGDPPAGKSSLERLFHYFNHVANVLPLIEVKGTMLQSRSRPDVIPFARRLLQA